MDIIETLGSILLNFLPLLAAGGRWIAIILLLAWLLDLCLGDPLWLPHPVVYMGKWIAKGEKLLNSGSHRKLKGAVFAFVSITGVFVLTAFVLFILNRILPYSVLGATVGCLLVFFCLAGHTLRNEVRMVFEALEKGLDDGRRQVARIVGRDTQNLSAQEVRTAALETLAENLSDGVIAPLFWFCLLGIPGMMTYKMINTLDSMIGYQNERYKDFGCWAAKIDDIANYIPARLTAFLILLANGVLKLFRIFKSSTSPKETRSVHSITFLFRNAGNHASPNSGWPEAALAAVLNCRFGGTHDYFGQKFYKPYIGDNPRPLDFHDMLLSIRVCFIAELLAILISLSITIAV